MPVHLQAVNITVACIEVHQSPLLQLPRMLAQSSGLQAQQRVEILYNVTNSANF